ncbi:hypothetical protein [Vibrio ezurae]|uniref:Uncharacterized protein n=1 Tax=Vibrio ezurae NBRC 102218 TaxID=1219080 RepID=U3AN11_9VIBR|nr:hypothetical protein [Vibrio ezurae]GAD81296.1 hypothetical protein VEZ01S_55_00120 [Vibrio ezurae NBRC 102218]
MTKEIAIFTAQQNYTTAQHSKGKMRRSLAHTLRCLSRLSEHEMKSIEWNENLSQCNYLYLDGELKPLNNLSESDKIALIESFNPPKIHNKKQKQTQLANYSAKLKSAIISEKKANNPLVEDAFQKLLDTPRSLPLSTKIINDIKPLLKKRVKQRINMLYKYIDAHNALTHSERSGQHTRIQEVIFKIPSKWQVSNADVTPEHNVELVHGFLNRILPNHTIKLSVIHGDEQLEHEDLCSHIHCFIDGQNKHTKEFDLRECEERVIQRYVTNSLSKEEQDFWTNSKNKKNYYHSKLRGEHWQAMFLLYTNYYFKKNEIELKGVRAEKTQKQLEKNKEMRREAKLPKAERSYNFHTRLLEEQQKLLEQKTLLEKEHEERKARINNELKTAQFNIEEHKKEIDELKQTIQTTQQEIQQSELSKQKLYQQQQQAKENLNQRTLDIEDKRHQQRQIIAQNKALEQDAIQLQERVEELEMKEVTLDISRSIAIAFAAIDRYIDAKKGGRHYESFWKQTIAAFKALNNRIAESSVMKYLKVHEDEIKDYSLTKELKTIQTPKLSTNKRSPSPEPTMRRP